MKLIIRADDVGYTDVCNIGAFETIERGVVTSADVMMDTPGTEDALQRLKAFPWISLGWHTHMWGSPVLAPQEVPSLVMADAGRIRFRKDLRTASDVVFAEALAECHAQIERCVRILGRAPDVTGGSRANEAAFGRAMRQVCDEYGIAYNATIYPGPSDGMPWTAPADPRWASRKIYHLGPRHPQNATQALLTDSLTAQEEYDPASFYLNDPSHMLELGADEVMMTALHPGYVDYYVYRLGDYGPQARNFILARPLDVEALCSDRLKNWIRQNRVELVNFRDALYGTREYQNHLRATGSDLCMI